jgi:DNA-binding Xre family transcriptional regulator
MIVVISQYIVLTYNNVFDKIAMCTRIGFNFKEVLIVTISCKLRLLLARVNVERVKQGRPPMSLRRLAGESGVSLSVLTSLNTGRSQRIDYTTIDNLLHYFSSYFAVSTSDLLVWEQDQEEESRLVSLGREG